MVREQTPILLSPLRVRRPCLSGGAGASQCLEFAEQRAELFEEADVFGAEIRELFCGVQLLPRADCNPPAVIRQRLFFRSTHNIS
jgi:hypothetical protein